MKYRDRYVLATGYPWVRQDCVEMYLNAKEDDVPLAMDQHSELDYEECPRYRLVLERVK